MKCGLYICLSVMALAGWAQKLDLKVHGFLSQGYLHSQHHDFLVQSRDGSFEFSEAALNIASQPTERMHLGMQLFARDLGNVDNHDVILDWAYADYRWRDSIGFRLGKIKQPLGFFNQARDAEFLRATVLLPQSTYSEGNRSLTLAYQGLCAYGHLLQLDYELYAGSISIDESLPSIQRLILQTTGGTVPAPWQVTNPHLFGASLKWQPLAGFTLGGSIIRATLDAKSQVDLSTTYRFTVDPFTLFFLSADYEYNRFKFTTEYSKIQGSTHGDFGDAGFRPGGYYGLFVYEWRDNLKSAYTYSVFYTDLSDHQATDFIVPGLPRHAAWQKDHALSISWDVLSQWNLKAEWHQVDGTGLIFTFGQGDLGVDSNRNWSFLALKTSFHF